MEFVYKDELPIETLPGRGIRKAVGSESYFTSTNMSVGYAMYNYEYGPMEPHQHDEETVIITHSNMGWMSWGDSKTNLPNRVELVEGMVIHIPNGEWHVFNYDEGGSVEIIFVYGTTANLRPEER